MEAGARGKHGMRLVEMNLDGYRGFRREKIKFGRQLTVLVGANGAGKSSVLDGLYVLLSHYSARLVGAKSSGVRLKSADIHIGSEEARLRLLACDDNYGLVSWMITKQGARQRVLKPTSSELTSLGDFARGVAERSGSEKYLAGETIPIYFDQSRAVMKIPVRRRTKASVSALSVFRDL